MTGGGCSIFFLVVFSRLFLTLLFESLQVLIAAFLVPLRSMSYFRSRHGAACILFRSLSPAKVGWMADRPWVPPECCSTDDGSREKKMRRGVQFRCLRCGRQRPPT